MNIIRILTPHILGIAGYYLCLYFIRTKKTPRPTQLLPLYILLFITLIGLTPSKWIRARPTKDQEADSAILFSFGYELDRDTMKPGEANQFLLDWTIKNNSSKLKLLLVQEGIWVAT